MVVIPETWRPTGRHFASAALMVALAALVPAAKADDFQAIMSKTAGGERTRVLVTGGWQVITGDEPVRDPESIVTGARDMREKRKAFLKDLKASGAEFNSAHPYRYFSVAALSAEKADLKRIKDARPNAKIWRDRKLELSLDDSTPIVEAPAAWSSELDGSGQMVAVVDTGVDGDHSFVGDKVVREACFADECPNGEPRMIGDGASTPKPSDGGGWYHGTHVAGIVAGENPDFSGVAPGAKIVAAKIYSGQPVPIRSSDVLAALDWVIRLRLEDDLPIAAVNLSLGGHRFTEPCPNAGAYGQAKVGETLRTAGILPVAASGNDSFTAALSIPACVPSFLSVGAIDKNGNVTNFSNAARFLDVLAPGKAIRSSVPKNDGYKALPGTSMAAPHVAGAAALLRQQNPEITPDEMAERFGAGPEVTDPRNDLAFARLDVRAALDLDDTDGAKTSNSGSANGDAGGLISGPDDGDTGATSSDGDGDGSGDGDWESIGG